MNTNKTAIEQVAIMLLVDAGAHHPALWSWIQAMANSDEECRFLGNYTIDESVVVKFEGHPLPLAECCQRLGYVTPTRANDRDNDIELAIEDKEPKGTRPETKAERDIARRDRIIYHLATEVAIYRAAGRPAGEQSLAKAIVEYHKATANAIYLENK